VTRASVAITESTVTVSGVMSRMWNGADAEVGRVGSQPAEDRRDPSSDRPTAQRMVPIDDPPRRDLDPAHAAEAGAGVQHRPAGLPCDQGFRLLDRSRPPMAPAPIGPPATRL